MPPRWSAVCSGAASGQIITRVAVENGAAAGACSKRFQNVAHIGDAGLASVSPCFCRRHPRKRPASSSPSIGCRAHVPRGPPLVTPPPRPHSALCFRKKSSRLRFKFSHRMKSNKDGRLAQW